MTKILKLTSILLLVVLCLGALASCEMILGLTLYEKRLEEEGYEIEVYDEEKLAEMQSDDYEIKNMLVATKSEGLLGLDVDMVSVIQFANADQAEKYADESLSAGIADLVMSVKVKGSVVIIGTEDAVEDAIGD